MDSLIGTPCNYMDQGSEDPIYYQDAAEVVLTPFLEQSHDTVRNQSTRENDQPHTPIPPYLVRPSTDTCHVSEHRLFKTTQLLSAEDKRGSLKVNEADDKGNDNIALPIAGFIFSLFMPPIGCLAFCFCLNAPEDSAKFRWSVRALYLGSLLSFVYSLLIAILLSRFYFETADKDIYYGASYQ